jgi:hypothetical protein
LESLKDLKDKEGNTPLDYAKGKFFSGNFLTRAGLGHDIERMFRCEDALVVSQSSLATSNSLESNINNDSSLVQPPRSESKDNSPIYSASEASNSSGSNNNNATDRSNIGNT